MRYSILFLLSFFINCASAHILSVTDAKLSSSEKIQLNSEKDKIALIGFYPSYLPKVDGTKPNTESLKKDFSLGKDIESFPMQSGDSKTSQEKAKEFWNIYKKYLSENILPELEKTISGSLKDTSSITWKEREVNYYVLGILGPDDLSKQGNIDLSTKRTWLTVISSILSTLTLGTVPALAYRDTETAIFIFEKDLYKVGELKSKATVFSYSAWWVHFLQERKDRKISDYYSDKIPYEIYYNPEIEKTEILFGSILQKKKK